jgi:hypothetical protein
MLRFAIDHTLFLSIGFGVVATMVLHFGGGPGAPRSRQAKGHSSQA